MEKSWAVLALTAKERAFICNFKSKLACPFTAAAFLSHCFSPIFFPLFSFYFPYGCPTASPWCRLSIPLGPPFSAGLQSCCMWNPWVFHFPWCFHKETHPLLTILWKFFPEKHTPLVPLVILSFSVKLSSGLPSSVPFFCLKTVIHLDLTFTSLSFASNYPSSPNHMCSCFISFLGLPGPLIMGALRVPNGQLPGNFYCLPKHKAPQNSLVPHNTMKSPLQQTVLCVLNSAHIL